MIKIIGLITNLSPITIGIAATIFAYLITAFGASLVFFIKSYNQKILDLTMGIAAGVMIAASFWSLLLPAIELCENLNRSSILEPLIGFIFGGIFIILSDFIISKKDHKNKKSFLLSSAMTLHNIPEGMAIGVAFGIVNIGIEGATLISALLLAFGIGIQNFPEGMCASLPLRQNGMSKSKAFFYGQLSGIVEPVFGIIGIIFSLSVQNILPILLAFSAGAMIAVVAMELIPDAFNDNKTLAAIGLILGFSLMMFLDVTLG